MLPNFRSQVLLPKEEREAALHATRQKRLATYVPADSFVLAADTVARALDDASLFSATATTREQREDELLYALLPLVARRAVVPQSAYRVGVAALGASGAVYLGVNIEFDGSPLFDAVHAEQCLVLTAYAAGEQSLRKLATSAPPCGYCRQFLNELGQRNDLVVLTVHGGERRCSSLSALLPYSFGPADLGNSGGLFVRTENTDIAWRSPDDVPQREREQLIAALSSNADADANADAADAATSLLVDALTALRTSYAPYTHSHSAVALRCADGATFAGAYAENCAFNPSLSPLQAALVALVGAGRTFDAVRDVLMLEQRDDNRGRAMHRAAAQANTARCLPRARFHYFDFAAAGAGAAPDAAPAAAVAADAQPSQSSG